MSEVEFYAATGLVVQEGGVSSDACLARRTIGALSLARIDVIVGSGRLVLLDDGVIAEQGKPQDAAVGLKRERSQRFPRLGRRAAGFLI